MGKPGLWKHRSSDRKIRSEPAEVKHLSKRRKRERKYVQCFALDLIPLVAASEKGGAQTLYF